MTIAARARAVRLAIFDVDGVMTDGTVFLGPRGEEFKAFNILDGHGVKMLHEAGIETAIITGRRSKAVALRARELGMRHVEQGVKDKLDVFRRLARRAGVSARECAYMGDDVQDVAVLRACGFAVSVPNAAREARAAAHWVTKKAGGQGAVREFCELVVRARSRARPRA
jgi:3-deoxy-D-manno-octulosonate 8-phosphate phosphatase (KDO 8-P phosphatase)